MGVVGVIVRVQHAIDMARARGDQLLAQIGSRVDQSRRRSTARALLL